MAENHDYVPTREADFDDWIENLVQYVKANAVSSGPPPKWTHIPQATIQELDRLKIEWRTNYGKTLVPHTNVDITAKNNSHKRLVAFVRPFVGQYLMYPPVTDEDRTAMALHNHDLTRTPTGKPKSRAKMTEIKPIGGFQIELRVHDELTPDSRAIPYGCSGCEIDYAWGDEKITDYDLLTKNEVMTHFPYRLSLEPKAEGKHFSCALRWINKRGEKGPLSEIYYTMVL